MRVAVLTSSRADFGIYLPLLKQLKADSFFDLKIIAFGTHLSSFHGHTIDQIYKEGFSVDYAIESMMLNDSEEAIATAMGLTLIKFAAFWKDHYKDFDVVFCLGDRYEMFAAVIAGLPFQITFAHLHGGEKTLGAIDNVFRHSISHASKIHFASTEQHMQRIMNLVDEPDHVYNVGTLGLDNILQMNLLDVNAFEQKWGINFAKASILVTLHPETVNVEKNEDYAKELIKVVESNQEFQFVITLPNADTAGNLIRSILTDQLKNNSRVFLIENFGTLSYFSAIKNCYFLLGNTSSGIIEAASFGKYVINIGNRQEGRMCGENVIQTPIVEKEINLAIQKIMKNPSFTGKNIYYGGNVSEKIVSILKNYNND